MATQAELALQKSKKTASTEENTKALMAEQSEEQNEMEQKAEALRAQYEKQQDEVLDLEAQQRNEMAMVEAQELKDLKSMAE